MKWSRLTKRTQPPKLVWLMRALTQAGIAHRLNGESFHAPILEVVSEEFDRAWKVLAPIDEVADDDFMFLNPFTARAWWLEPSTGAAATVAAFALLANKIRRSIADGVSCVPEGACLYECPLSVGVIAACPADLFAVCGPMIRVETLGLALAQGLGLDSDQGAIKRCGELVEQLQLVKRTLPLGVQWGQMLIAVCYVLAQAMTRDAFEGLAGHSMNEIALTIQSELVLLEGDVLVPREVGTDLRDLIGQDWRRRIGLN